MISLIKIYKHSFLLVLFLLGASVVLHAQKRKVVENGAIYKFKYSVFKLKFPKRIAGNLIETDFKVQTVKDLDGDTVIFSMDSVRRAYFPDEIRLYDNGHYQYKHGKLKNLNLGFGQDHFNIDFSYLFRFDNRFEIGMGVGINNNSFLFHTSTNQYDVNVLGIPLFISGKYFLTQTKNQLYVKGKIGFTNSISTWEIPSVKNGVLMDGGAGVLFSSLSKNRVYIELSQYLSYAKGSADLNDVDVLSNVEFSVWFSRFLFTFGLEFGK